MNLLNFFLDLLYPRRCLSCGKFGDYICHQCALKIQFIETNICPICERPAIDGKTHPVCERKYALDGLTSFFAYQGVIRKAIKTIKYKPLAFDISQALVSLALKRVDQENPVFTYFISIILENPTLVSIPLHPSRERLRGFNQAEVLGKLLAEKWSLSFVKDLLLRKRPTKPQYQLKKEEREKNIKGAFELNSKYSYEFIRPTSKNKEIEGVLAGQNLPQHQSRLSGAKRGGGSLKFAWSHGDNPRSILLFDDVWTTGATMRACANVLKRAGAKFVWGLTLAR